MTDIQIEEVSIMCFESWFISAIRQVLYIELEPLDHHMEASRQLLHLLHEQSTALRSSSHSSSLPHVQRKQKLCDQCDALISQYASPDNSFATSLPGLELWEEYSTRLRKKLRLVDEMAAAARSKLSVPEDGERAAMIQRLASQISEHLDGIDEYCELQHITLSYLDDIKHNELQPLCSLLADLESVLRSDLSSRALRSAEDTLREATAAHHTARTAPVLVHTAKQRRDAETIVSLVDSMLSPLRAVVRSMSEEGSIRPAQRGWYKVLSPLLSLPTIELLTLCCHNTSKMDELAGAALEATEFCSKSAAISNEDSNDEQLNEATGLLDVQLLAAYRDDWRSRVQDVDATVASQEFARRYRDLCKARDRRQQAITNLEAKQAQHISNAGQVLMLKKQIMQLRPRLQEMCVHELQRVVRITTPWDDETHSTHAE